MYREKIGQIPLANRRDRHADGIAIGNRIRFTFHDLESESKLCSCFGLRRLEARHHFRLYTGRIHTLIMGFRSLAVAW